MSRDRLDERDAPTTVGLLQPAGSIYPAAVKRSTILALMVAALAPPCASGAATPQRIVLGRSVDGRAIVADHLGAARSARTILVVGCIHGNEPAGIAIADALLRLPAPRGVALWVVPDLNPDGVAAGTRGNANGVDLNRNFPTRWQRLTGVYDSGAKPLSEPESRVAYRLIERIRPAISIWFHQHESVVDTSSGNKAVERRFARLVGLPTAVLTQYPGSAVTWESARLPNSTSFVVELPAGALSPARAQRFAAAIGAIARP